MWELLRGMRRCRFMDRADSAGGRCDSPDFPTCTALMREIVANIADARTLRHAAVSPKWQAFFESKMQIVSIGRQTVPVQLPQSLEEWNEAIQKALT